MNTNLTLDDMILQYSENPFIDRNMYNMSAVEDQGKKKNMLQKLLLVASNFFSPKEPSTPETYKRRYEYEVKG